MKREFAVVLLSVVSAFSQQQPTQSMSASPGTPQASASAPAVSPDAQAVNDLLRELQSAASKSDADIARMRIEKWKTEPAAKQQAQSSATSIRRNLTNAVPDLVQRIQAAPGSLNANFRLYWNLNVLYDTFSSFAESAGAFGPKDQYDALAQDVAMIDQIRKKVAERVDMLAGANDAELARLRARVASTASAAKPTKVVVDDEQPKPKKKKTTQSTSQTAPK